jgi:hypothetical protein
VAEDDFVAASWQAFAWFGMSFAMARERRQAIINRRVRRWIFTNRSSTVPQAKSGKDLRDKDLPLYRFG